MTYESDLRYHPVLTEGNNNKMSSLWLNINIITHTLNRRLSVASFAAFFPGNGLQCCCFIIFYFVWFLGSLAHLPGWIGFFGMV